MAKFLGRTPTSSCPRITLTAFADITPRLTIDNNLVTPAGDRAIVATGVVADPDMAQIAVRPPVDTSKAMVDTSKAGTCTRAMSNAMVVSTKGDKEKQVTLAFELGTSPSGPRLPTPPDAENTLEQTSRRSSIGTGLLTNSRNAFVSPSATAATVGDGNTPVLELSNSPELTAKEVAKKAIKEIREIRDQIAVNETLLHEAKAQREEIAREAEDTAREARMEAKKTALDAMKAAKKTADEAFMKAEETTRKAEEAAKEIIRKAEETARKAEETARKAEEDRNEHARKAEETARKAKEDRDEHARKAEEAALKAEEAAVKVEEDRKETARKAAETALKAEADRDKHARKATAERVAFATDTARASAIEHTKTRLALKQFSDEQLKKTRELEDTMRAEREKKDDLEDKLNGLNSELALLNAKADATQDSLASIEAKMAAKKEISKKMSAVDTFMKGIAQTMNELAQAGADVFKDPKIAN